MDNHIAIEQIINSMLAHEIDRQQAVQSILNLINPQSTPTEPDECTCDKDSIFFDDKLNIIWCMCGKLFANENREIYEKAGIDPEDIPKMNLLTSPQA